MLTELRNKETIKTNKKQTGLNRKPSKKGKGKKVTRNFDESSITDAGSENEITIEDNKKIKTNEKRKKKIKCLDSDSSSTDSGLEDEVTYANSDESMWMEEENESNQESNNEKSISEIDSPTGEEDKENVAEEAKSQSIDIKTWVIVKYALKKGLKYYVGVVQKKVGSRWEVKFVRRKGATFAWPLIKDTDEVTADCIVKILPNPEITKRGIIYFDYKFRNMIIS
ncbi:unnamed protein product [Arctia plantaginis]|uniref:Uncharacterized protein n=1 Tax=Arctia plantaginis TaxID=874455 RepID=A0A8S1AJE5_ARCPL|nr:unnamed protein product [Arctia plantaginis]